MRSVTSIIVESFNPSRIGETRRLTRLLFASILLVSFVASQSSLAQDTKPDQPEFRAPQQTFTAQAAGRCGNRCGSSGITPDKCSDTTFVVDCSSGLDTGCTYRSSGPLVFAIQVTRVVGDVQKLKANGLISPAATLRMPAYDVDFVSSRTDVAPERDRVYFNDHLVPSEFLTGTNQQWKMNEFRIPIEWVKFPADPDPGGTVTPVDNLIRIEIDTANTTKEAWCTAIDWASLSFEFLPRPVVMVHGFNSNGGTWDRRNEFSWVRTLDELGVPHNNEDGAHRFNLGVLDTIHNNARKIADEVAAAQRRWGVDQVWIVSHSKGGLDAREFVEASDAVEKLAQIATPNAGTPLATQGTAMRTALGLLSPGTSLGLRLRLPGLDEITPKKMSDYNNFHKLNPKVSYLALAGNYTNPVTGLDRSLTRIVGPGDTVVPVTSVYALNPGPGISFVKLPTFNTSGNQMDAKHTRLLGSAEVFDRVFSHWVLPVAPTAASVAATEASSSMARTATVAGVIRQGQVQRQALRIDQAAPAFFSLLFLSGDLDLALISPSGQRFDAFTVIGNPNVSRDEGEIPGFLTEVYSFTTLEVGMWAVEVSAPSVTDPAGSVVYAVSGWLENPAITFTGSLAKASVPAGEPLSLVGTLKNGSVPLTGASVMAGIVLPDNTTRQVVLHDDGAAGDATASDGIYTGNLTDTSQPGDYSVIFTASRTAFSGVPAFSREDFALATVSRSSSTITGAFRDYGSDTDGDGLFNNLIIEVNLNVTVAANYRLFGILVDVNGHTHEASTQATLRAGSNTISLAFDGEAIFQNRVDGPYRLTTLRLAEEEDTEIRPLDERADAHQTMAYRFRDFQHSPIALTGQDSAIGVDTNGNGRFDLLRVGIEVEVVSSGTYDWSARLTDRDGKEIGFIANSSSLNAGLNTLDLAFNGELIGRNGIDGPYFVRGLLIFGAGASLVISDAFTTEPFLASQFEGAILNQADLLLTQTTSPNPVVVDSQITYTITVTNRGPSAATTVMVTDSIPVITAFVSCSSTGGGVCGGSGNNRTVTFDSLAPGASAMITIVANVPCSVTDGLVISNTAIVSAVTYDPTPGNNSATATFTVTNQTTLSPASAHYPASDSTGTVIVTTLGNCGVSVTSEASWIKVISIAAVVGSSSSRITYRVEPNPDASPRSTRLIINGKPFPVTQDSSLPPQILLEAEAGSSPGPVMWRSNASNLRTVWLHAGQWLKLSFYIPVTSCFRLDTVCWSNDNLPFAPSESVDVLLDGNNIGRIIADNTGSLGGGGWNVFKCSDPIGILNLQPGTHEITLTVSGGDGYGVEIDVVKLSAVSCPATSQVSIVNQQRR